MAAEPNDQQRHDWLAWEAELREAMRVLRGSAGDHRRVLQYLDDRASLAMHNAYCAQPIPFAGSGLPPRSGDGS